MNINTEPEKYLTSDKDVYDYNDFLNLNIDFEKK